MALGVRACGERSGGGASGGRVQEREGGDGGGLWCCAAVVMCGDVDKGVECVFMRVMMNFQVWQISGE